MPAGESIRESDGCFGPSHSSGCELGSGATILGMQRFGRKKHGENILPVGPGSSYK